MVDTLFLGSLPYSGRDTTLTGSLHLTWGKRITEKSPICRQRRREPTGRKIATKRGNRFLNNNNASMRLHASEQLSAVNLTKVASRSRRFVNRIDFAASSGEERLESESMTSEIPDFQVQEPPEKEATTQTEGPKQNEAGSQTEEFDYMFMPAGYQASDQEYFDSYAKVRFYTGLPSYEVLMVVFEHVSSHVSRQTQNLSRFQEFVMVLIKLRLNEGDIGGF